MSKGFYAFKVASGLAITGGLSFAGYKYIEDNEIEIVKTNNKTFLVQSENENIQNITGFNYFCSLDEEIDNDCQIISLNFNQQKYVDMKEIIDSKKPSDSLTKNSFYKLLIDINKIKTPLHNNISQITIQTTEDQQDTATLKIISLIDETQSDNSINFDNKLKILVKSDKANFENVEFNSKCKNAENNAVTMDCKIYKFDEPSHKHLFDFSKIKKIEKVSEIQTAQYYVVVLERGEKNNIDDEKITKIFIDAGDKKQMEFSFVSKIITNIEELTSEETDFQAIILSADFGKNTHKNTYIIAKSSDEHEIKEGFLSGENKNYSCQIDEVIHENCSIVSLQNNEKNLSSITFSDTQPEDLKTSGKYYKIIVNNKIITQIGLNGNDDVITIVNKNKNEEIFGKLKVLFLIEDGVPTRGVTDLLIGSVDEIDNEELKKQTDMNLACLNQYSSEEKCDIYKFEDPKVNLENISDDLNKKLIKIEDIKNLKKDDLYLVNLKTFKLFVLDRKTLEFLNQDKKKVFSLKINTPLINKSFNNGNFDGTIILK